MHRWIIPDKTDALRQVDHGALYRRRDVLPEPPKIGHRQIGGYMSNIGGITCQRLCGEVIVMCRMGRQMVLVVARRESCASRAKISRPNEARESLRVRIDACRANPDSVVRDIMALCIPNKEATSSGVTKSHLASQGVFLRGATSV